VIIIINGGNTRTGREEERTPGCDETAESERRTTAGGDRKRERDGQPLPWV
jgi:hypothetical protein